MNENSIFSEHLAISHSLYCNDFFGVDGNDNSYLGELDGRIDLNRVFSHTMPPPMR